MGNQKHKWTADEEEALLAGIKKHGPGKWKNILKDPEFAPFLTHRSNIDLKDKWRNLSVNTAPQGAPKEKPKNIKIKTEPAPPSSTQIGSVATPLRLCAPSDAVTDDSSTQEVKPALQEVKPAPQYNVLIFEALSKLSDSSGSDLNAIVSFIEQNHEVPQNHRRAISARLRKLVDQGRLEKVQNHYRIKRVTTTVDTKPIVPKQIDSRPRQLPVSVITTSHESVMDAVEIAASKVAEAEHKSHWAAEATKEAEKFSKLAEDADAMLQLAKEIYEQCSQGEIMLLT